MERLTDRELTILGRYVRIWRDLPPGLRTDQKWRDLATACRFEMAAPNSQVMPPVLDTR